MDHRTSVPTVIARKNACKLLSFVLMGALCPGVAKAQLEKPGIVSEAPKQAQVATDYKVNLLSRPLRLADFEGMRPRPELVGQLTAIKDFVQTSPNDGRVATQKTEAYIGRTSSALYVVFVCFDTDPRLIRGHLARRENITKDDTVSVLLDPFQDHRRGVLFQLNPAGVQADAAWTEGSSPDYSYDQVCDSAGQVTSR